MFEEKIIKISNIDYINVQNEEINFLVSLKNDEGDYKRDRIEFSAQLAELRDELKLKDIGYLHQIHSSSINIYDGTIKEADAIISDKKGVGVCVYTADCVPILVKHKFLEIKAAIHSGWKGTYDIILYKTIKFLESEYNISSRDLIFLVGPHIRDCCYEVSKEIVDDFNNNKFYKGKDISHGRMLNLTKCIELQLEAAHALKENCKTLLECTKCSDEYRFHSYRNNKECGRMISLVY